MNDEIVKKELVSVLRRVFGKMLKGQSPKRAAEGAVTEELAIFRRQMQNVEILESSSSSLLEGSKARPQDKTKYQNSLAS
ncbi:hypothetical protein [Leptospira sp. P2653]|uniref:hypothetical protein n=1 Tax=Leptospira sp. P2653 TaxID=1218600 RepID=UPI0002C028AD|nr:hypothetical protein [Leptospira sp. P2653]EMJ63510.1 hypothetical protein LEP1GSC051_0355 [Leptospira sp. P2653]